jgi:hypothetical protein
MPRWRSVSVATFIVRGFIFSWTLWFSGCSYLKKKLKKEKQTKSKAHGSRLLSRTLIGVSAYLLCRSHLCSALYDYDSTPTYIAQLRYRRSTVACRSVGDMDRWTDPLLRLSPRHVSVVSCTSQYQSVQPCSVLPPGLPLQSCKACRTVCDLQVATRERQAKRRRPHPRTTKTRLPKTASRLQRHPRPLHLAAMGIDVQ